MTNHVLVVEDDFIIRRLLAEELAEAGMDVVESGTGDTAIDLLRHGTAVDVLITDVEMPGQIDGIGVGRFVRENFPNAAIIYVTGQPDRMKPVDRRGGRDIVLAKPYQIADVLSAIGHLLGGEKTMR